nr:unnamed protein product [Callosobruchus chinensis]
MLQNESFYKEKAKSVHTVRHLNKVSSDIFSPQTTMSIGNQSNKDGNQVSQLYMVNLPSASCSYQTEDAKTCSYMNINKSYSGALYTNSTNYSRYNYTTDVSSNQNYYKPATSKAFDQDKLLEGVANLDANKYCGSPVKKPGSEVKSNPFNPPVNWMTTADTKTDCFLPQLRTKHYTWSTTKFSNIFEPPQTFVPHSMPSLPFNPSSLIEQKPKEKRTIQQENQSNFLSVSQLVDHNKSDSTSAPARVTTRRNSGNRSKGTNPSKNKRTPKTDTVDKSVENKHNSGLVVNNEYCYEQKQSNRNRNSMSYSAEALIGNQGNEFSNKKVVSAESKSLVTTNFLADSMVTYFPSMDDNYIPHNNFPSNNFPHNSFQSAPYSTNNFLYSTPSVAPNHAPPNAFEAPPDFLSDSMAEMKDLKHTKSMNKEEKTQNCSNGPLRNPGRNSE